MTNTISESEYQDCTEELTEALGKERKLSSEKNLCIISLEEQIGQTMAFIAEFELWFTEYKESRKDKKSKTPALYSHMHMSWITAMRHIDEAWNELKAQHLGDSKGG